MSLTTWQHFPLSWFVRFVKVSQVLWPQSEIQPVSAPGFGDRRVECKLEKRHNLSPCLALQMILKYDAYSTESIEKCVRAGHCL